MTDINISKEELIYLEKICYSQKEFLSHLNLKFTKKNQLLIKNIYKSFNLPFPEFKKTFFERLDINLAIDIINHSNNYSEALLGFGKSDRASNIDEIKKFIINNNIDISHFNKKDMKSTTYKQPLYLLKQNSEIGRKSIRNILFKFDLIKYECNICGLQPEWNGKKMTLTLDHINGINNDNRLHNLRFVCPNCDSQLDTYAGRNIKKMNIPTKIDIEIFKIKQLQKYNFNCIIEFFHTSYIPIVLTKSIINNIYTKRRKTSYIKDFKNEHGNICICEKCGADISKQGKTQICVNCYIEKKNNLIKGIENTKKPNLEQIQKDLEELGSYLAVAKKYEVSDNAVRKWIKKYGSEKISTDYINFKKKVKEISEDFKKGIKILSYNYKNYTSIMHIRSEKKKNNLSKEKLDLIKKHNLPLFEAKSPQEILEERKIEYINFIKEHKRKPVFSDKVSIEEKFLGRWYQNTKRRYINYYTDLNKEIEELLK